MNIKYLFDIPIYWCDGEEFNNKYDQNLNKYMGNIENLSDYSLNSDIRLLIESTFWKNYIAPWRYNQIVGWIRIYKLESQIRGELWFINAKRFSRNLRKKQFSLHGEAFEISIWPEQNSNQIFKSILKACIGFRNNFIRNIFLDMENFNELGKYVDWRKLMST